jgi:MFS family permease
LAAKLGVKLRALMKLRILLALLFAIFLDLVGFGMAFPDVQLRAEQFGAPGWLIGILLSSYFITQFLVSPHWGRLSDRIGRKPVLSVCTALSALSMVVYAFADSIWGILFARILAGLAAANVVVAQAYIADNTPEDQRQKSMGQMSSAVLIGLIAGPAIGGFLAELGGNRLMGLTAAGASTLSLLWILLAVPHQPPAAERQPGKAPLLAFGILRELPDLRRIFWIAAAGWFVVACLEGTFGRLIKHNLGYGQAEFGIVFSWESLVGALIGLGIGWLSKRMSSSAIIRSGYVLQALGLGYTPFARNLIELLVCGSLFALGTGITNPTLNAVGSLVTPPTRQGELFGVLQATRSLGFFVGPMIGGLLFDQLPMAPYLLAGGVAAIAALIIRVPEPNACDPRLPGESVRESSPA